MKHPIIEDLSWRYATKKYNPELKISDENIEIIKESLRLVPTSYGLFPLKYIFVESKELRAELRPKAWGQSQITDASHLLVICSHIELDHDFIDGHIELTAKTRNIEPSTIQGYGNFVKTKIGEMSAEKHTDWNAKQAYIALGQLMHTCASLRIDATPMEGFEPAAFDEILDLGKDNLKSVLVCAMGYRSEEDNNQHLAKVRKSSDDIFEVR